MGAIIVGLFRLLYLSSLILWLGSMVYFTLFVTPKVFGTVSLEMAGRLVEALFPSYYGIGMLSGLVMIVATLYLTLKGRKLLQWVNTVLIGIMLILTLYAGLILHPEIRIVKAEADKAIEPAIKNQALARFGRLHRTAIVVNTVVLVAGIGVVILTGCRREILFPDGE